MLLRELAAMHRVDLVLVVSPYERDLLINTYGIPPEKVTFGEHSGNIRHSGSGEIRVRSFGRSSPSW
jgi:hypothetical protein